MSLGRVVSDLSCPQVKEQTSKELTLTHTTPVKGYVDDLTFNFNSTSTSGSCLVKVSDQPAGRDKYILWHLNSSAVRMLFHIGLLDI